MPPLTYTTTLDRQLVHRWSVAEVFVTDLHHDGPAAVTAAAQWPRHHPYFDAGDDRYCLLVAAETFRQVVLAALHATGLAESADQFVMKRMGFEWVGEAPAVGDRPLDLQVSLCMTPAGRAGRHDLRVTIADGERDLLRGTGVVIVLAPPVYAHLRQGRTEPGVRVDSLASIPCEAISRTRPQDVVLVGPPSGPWDLRVDTTHPTLFDHPCDHVPGMLLFEAARQAAILTTGTRAVVSMAADFGAFMEVDAPTRVCAETEEGSLVVTVSQGGTVGARVEVTVAP
ncbi:MULTISPECIES: ScbA/BarX family gamma-butyrolactone biosynthesis protein [unclassified Knoellia]|uniref:ScbA/BarX family gamma-butyrolactone biosynthesis protein n=1 Tax=Knoellia altitudinis TaxID=3404795 RepID=UPI00361AEF76